MEGAHFYSKSLFLRCRFMDLRCCWEMRWWTWSSRRHSGGGGAWTLMHNLVPLNLEELVHVCDELSLVVFKLLWSSSVFGNVVEVLQQHFPWTMKVATKLGKQVTSSLPCCLDRYLWDQALFGTVFWVEELHQSWDLCFRLNITVFNKNFHRQWK